MHFQRKGEILNAKKVFSQNGFKFEKENLNILGSSCTIWGRFGKPFDEFGASEMR